MKSPVLVIHGTNDNIIDFSHGVGIYNQCLNALDPLWVKGMFIIAQCIYNKTTTVVSLSGSSNDAKIIKPPDEVVLLFYPYV